MSVNTYLNTQTPPVQQFINVGKYLVELDINTAGPAGGNYCQVQLFDTINIVDTAVQILVSDTTVCAYSPVTFLFNAKGGYPPYTYRLFIYPDTFYTPLNGPFYSATSYTFNPVKTTQYIVQARDQNGCRGYDYNVYVTAQKPLIGNISGPQNLDTVSSPVIYSVAPKINDAFFWIVSGGNIFKWSGY